MVKSMIFSGSTSGKIAANLAQDLEGHVGKINLSVFANGELQVLLKEERIPDRVILVQSLVVPVERNLVEFCLICDALTRMGVRDITAVIPWMGYSKQDKVFRPGEPLSIKVIAKMLQVVPLKRLISFDLHNPAILGFFDIPVINLTARPLFIEYFKKKATDATIVVAPDAGAVKSSSAFADALGVPVVYLDKHRDLTTGKVTVRGMSRDVTGAQAIIIDDMIVTGSTIIETAHVLREAGAASVSVAATHHLYVDGAQQAIEESGVSEVVVSDTVEAKAKSDKLKELSVVPILVDAIKDKDA